MPRIAPPNNLVGSPLVSRISGLVPRDRRRTRPLMLTAAGLLLFGVGWLLVTGLCARSELLAVRSDLQALRDTMSASPSPASTAATTKPEARTEAVARSAAAHAGRAHWLTTGPAWYLAAHLPYVGGPLETIRGTATAADRLTGEVLPPVVGTSAKLLGEARADGRHLDLAALRRAAPALEHAASRAAATRAEAERLPRHTWLPAADRAREQLVGQLSRVVPAVQYAATGARLLPPMLGADRPRHYFVVFENPAEARGTGGMPGAFAVLTADGGRLAFEEFGHDAAMMTTRPTVDLGAEFAAMYAHNDPVHTWPSSNLSPHFPYAARIWSAAWRDKSGQRVDGVISLDPAALARLLGASGPTRTSDGTAVTADNVVDITERTNYATYRDELKRKDFLLDVARSASGQLLAASEDPGRRRAVFASVYEVLRNGQMTVWSAHPDEQRELESRPAGGALPRNSAPYAGLVVNNAAGTKLDYYLDRTLEWSPGRCTRDGREVTVRIGLTNRAPSSGLPSYVTARLDKPPYVTRRGDNRLLVSYYATAGANLTRATVNGRPAFMSPGVERGHPVFTFDVEVPTGSTRTLELHLTEPADHRAPTVLRQHLPRPLRVVVRPSSGCGEDQA